MRCVSKEIAPAVVDTCMMHLGDSLDLRIFQDTCFINVL